MDVRVIEAIRRALETGEPQKLEPRARGSKIDTTAQRQTIAARKQPRLVNAHPPQEG